MRKEEVIKERGQVIETLRGLLFKVKLDSGREILAYLGGKLKRHRIKVLPGEKVLVEFTLYDKERGRIVYRLK